jgi:hypothetical protein
MEDVRAYSYIFEKRVYSLASIELKKNRTSPSGAVDSRE